MTLDLHQDPHTGKLYTVGGAGELIPYPPTPEPALEDLSWQELKSMALSQGLGEKPDSVTWLEWVKQGGDHGADNQ